MTDQHLPQVVLAPEPFTPRAEVLEVPALGQKVSDLVAAAIRQGKLKDDADTIRRLRVHVNGVPLPADTKEQRLAAMRYVPQGGEIVNLVVVVQGGGGGGGNKVLQTVLTLAVVALSIWTGGAAGPLASSAAWVRAAASAAVAVGGQMAIGAIFSPNEERVRESNDPGALQDGSNSYRPRAPMPLCLGFRRWGFDLAAPPYTQVIGNDVYLNIALAPHYGRCWVGNLKVGETALQDLPANEWAVEYFLEPGVPRRSTLYPKSTVQENYQDKLNFAGGGVWEVHTLQGGADRASVDITNPQGLYFNADSGKKRNEEYAGQIQFAEVGTENWQAATFPGYNTARDKNNRPLPAGSFYLNLRSFDPIRRTYEWALPDQSKQYKVRVRAWDPEGDDPSDTSRVWATYWTALRSIRNDPPIIDQNLSVIFLRIKTSDDLNGNLPLVTGECEPIVPIYQNGNWDTEARTSNGAALLRWLLTGPAAARPMIPAEFHSSCETTYQLIEANPTWKGALLVTDDKSQQDVMVGLGNMGRFSTFWNGSRLCFVPDWVREAPRQVFSGRNASGYRYRRTFPEPIHAVFVEFLNIDGGTVDDEMYVYADGYNAANTTLIETLKIDFACSPERAFQEGRVYLAKRLLQVEMHEWSAGAEAIATTYGDRVLVRHQATLYGLADGRVINRFFQGALVSGFRFDEEVEMEAGKTYGIDVRRADGVIRSIPVVTEPGRTNVLKFAAPREVNLSPSKGDLVIFGETDVISEDLEIVDVEPQDDMTVTFRGVPYIADAIAGAINNPIPPLPSVISERVPAPRPIVPRPESVEPEGLVVQASAGPWNGPPVASFMARYRVITEDVEEGTVVGEWQVLDPVPASNGIIRTPAITGAAHPPADGQQVVIDLEVRTVLRSGETSLPTQISAIPVVANIPTPAAFSALGVTRTSASDGSSFGAISIQAAAILTGDIQTLEVEVQPAGGGAWVTPTGGLISARNPQGDVTGLNSGAPGYKVRARWIRSDNWPGPWVQEQNAVIPGGSNVSSDTANVGGVPSGSVAQFYVFERPAILDDLAEARATLYTATSGLVDQTAALFSQLNTPTTGVLARLTTVETRQTTDNSAAVGRLNALEATVNTPETGVVARLATAENAIATNNSAAVGRLQALEASVNTPMTGLLARMATQEAATVSLQTGKADASRVTTLEARRQGVQNLIQKSRVVSRDDTVTFGASKFGFKMVGTGSGSQERSINVGPLKRGVPYSLAISARRLAGSGSKPINVDLYPDTLPEITLDIQSSVATRFVWEGIVSTHADMERADVKLRFFRSSMESGLNVEITDIMLVEGPVAPLGWAAAPEDTDAAAAALAARTASLETATANLQTGKADASRVALVEAIANTRGNLCPNGGLENGKVGVSGPGGLVIEDDPTWGRVAKAYNNINGTYGFSFPRFSVQGLHTYTVSGDTLLFATSGKVYLDMIFLRADGTVTLDGPERVTSGHDFSNDPDRIQLHAVSAVAPADAVTAEARVVFSEVVGAQVVGFRRIKVEAGGLPATPYTSEKSSVDLFGRVTTTESAATDLYNRTRARWALGVAVPGADAFMQAQAETAPGQAPTSSVAIGARVFAVYNQIGQNWVKALEVVNGNAIFTGGLQAGAFIRLGNGNGWPVALKPVDYNLSDGEVVTFGTDLGGLPALSFALNNLAPLNSGETYDVKPLNLTATGFTLSAKINIPATPSNQSLPGPGSTGSIDGISVRFATLDGRPEAADGTYTIQTAGYTSVRVPRNTQVSDYEGSGTIRVWALKNGSWVVVALIHYNWYELFENPTNQYNYQQASWSTYDTVQLGSGVQGIAVGLPSPTESIGLNAALSSFGPTNWQAQGSGSGVRTATPNGQKTRVTVRPQ